MTELSPIPYRVRIIDQNGLITRNWQQFFESLLRRVGGVGAMPDLGEVGNGAVAGDEFDPGLARADAMQQALTDLEMLMVMEGLGSAMSPDLLGDGDVFGAPLVSAIEALRQKIEDIEALTLFSW